MAGWVFMVGRYWLVGMGRWRNFGLAGILSVSGRRWRVTVVYLVGPFVD